MSDDHQLLIDGEPFTFGVIKPGDKVLLLHEHEISQDQAQRVSDILTTHMPDVEFVVTGGFKAIVKRSD